MVPPYCGLPSESHQWPVGADVTVVLDVTTAEVVVVELVGTTVEVVFVVVVVVVVVLVFILFWLFGCFGWLEICSTIFD